jgi:hypothetical protein
MMRITRERVFWITIGIASFLAGRRRAQRARGTLLPASRSSAWQDLSKAV